MKKRVIACAILAGSAVSIAIAQVKINAEGPMADIPLSPDAKITMRAVDRLSLSA